METVIFLIVFAACYYVVSRALRAKKQATETPRLGHSSNSFPFSEFRDDEHLAHVRTIRTKIRGVTKRNADGTDRQRTIRERCHPGDALYMRREPNNPADPCAIQVRRIVCTEVPDSPCLAEQLGYLSRDLAQELAPKMDEQGFVLIGEIMEVIGGDSGHSFGVNIRVEEYRPGSSK